MIIRWLDEAISDLIEIRDYIANDKPQAAQAVAGRIRKTVDLLKDQPGIGRPGRVEGTKELIIPGLPYIIPYRVKANSIEILRVLHTARKT
ncbi:MAG: type II toxin-antitoxin system RelE/ParE family toxin [Thermodesulfovibrionales bacterium]